MWISFKAYIILFLHLFALMFSVLHGTNSSVGYKWEHPTADLRYIENFVFVLLLKTLSAVKIVYWKMCCQWLLRTQFNPDQN